ncbi:MAG TPA: hypothetical protein VKG79_02415 [Bryobacteraceae bacterium]|nr:hypothetical protein [Bryobacteraceae bacterium]
MTKLPRLLPVRQHFPDRALRDVPGEVHRQLSSAQFAARVKPGARIALGVGSRGISNIAPIVRATVDYWKSHGCEPFIFPAMGSHGAATAQGQADVLARFGIHEGAMGCPIVSALDVVSLGKTADGIEAFMDRSAFASDAIMAINRIKWHTDYSGGIESGLFKMLAIGVGKLAGAQRYHTYGYKLGLEHVIRTVGRQVLSSGKVVGGLAILEDAYHNTAQLSAVPADGMEQTEGGLLELVKSWRGKIPIPLDILILDEIGKNISGMGMDTKVVNRGVHGDANPWPELVRIERIFVRDISSGSYGNAVGIGMADVIHDRLLEKVDWRATHINSLTASTPTGIRTPIHFASDLECLEKIGTTVGRLDLAEVNCGWFKNSLELSFMKLSENLRPEIQTHPALEILGPAEEMDFDSAGNLSAFTSQPQTVGAD